MSEPVVGIVMGSDSDWPVMEPAAVSAFWASTGYRGCASTSAANGAISRSAISRTAARIASCSSLSAYSPPLLPTGRS